MSVSGVVAVKLRISLEGGLSGIIIGGMLFSLKTLLSSVLYDPGLARLLMYEYIMQVSMVAAVSFLNQSEVWGIVVLFCVAFTTWL